jgi:hypothetical protein
VSRTEVYCCSTLLSLATALAWRAAPDGRTGPDREPVRRVLLACDYAPAAEVRTPLLGREGTADLLGGFDVVVDVNALLAPYHPASFDPGPDAARLLGRLLAAEWGATGAVELVVEPIQVAFARWLLHALPDAPVTVVADGLMAYGPSRDRVPPWNGRRITRLVHLDLVPGLRPVYLSEHAVPAEAVPCGRLRKVLDGALASVGEPVQGAPGGGLVLGQYLSGLGLLSEEEEQQLYLDALVQVAGETALRGAGGLAFKPHPAASPLLAAGLRRAAAAKGLDVELLPASGPAEALFAGGRYAVVGGCFSTALLTAFAGYGMPAIAVGTGLLLERLRPFQNSNRIPVTIVDALLRPAAEVPPDEVVSPADVGELVAAVAYCMQAERYLHLRERARATLDAHPAWRDRYVKRRRLQALGLAAPAPVTGRPPLRSVRRLAAQAVRRTLRRTLRRTRASS